MMSYIFVENETRNVMLYLNNLYFYAVGYVYPINNTFSIVELNKQPTFICPLASIIVLL
jgi:hypothetical protein